MYTIDHVHSVCVWHKYNKAIIPVIILIAC